MANTWIYALVGVSAEQSNYCGVWLAQYTIIAGFSGRNYEFECVVKQILHDAGTSDQHAERNPQGKEAEICNTNIENKLTMW